MRESDERELMKLQERRRIQIEARSEGVEREKRERKRAVVSLRIAEDTDLNINSQSPYRALIIDYQ